MRMKRLLAGVVSAALLGLAPAVLAAAPAEAGVAIITRVVPNGGLATNIETGKTFSLDGEVQYSTNGGSTWTKVPFNSGSTTVQRKLKGTSTWSTIETDTYGDSFYFYPITATQNADYRLAYSGGSANGVSYPAAEAIGYQAVLRKLDVKTRYGTLVVKGKISPDFKKKKFTVQVKRGGWKTWRKVKTDGKGKYAVKLVGSRKGTKYRFVVPGNTKYTKTMSGPIKATTYRY